MISLIFLHFFFLFNVLPLATLRLISQLFLKQKEKSERVYQALSLRVMPTMQVEAHPAEDSSLASA